MHVVPVRPSKYIFLSCKAGCAEKERCLIKALRVSAPWVLAVLSSSTHQQLETGYSLAWTAQPADPGPYLRAVKRAGVRFLEDYGVEKGHESNELYPVLYRGTSSALVCCPAHDHLGLHFSAHCAGLD